MKLLEIAAFFAGLAFRVVLSFARFVGIVVGMVRGLFR